MCFQNVQHPSSSNLYDLKEFPPRQFQRLVLCVAFKKKGRGIFFRSLVLLWWSEVQSMPLSVPVRSSRSEPLSRQLRRGNGPLRSVASLNGGRPMIGWPELGLQFVHPSPPQSIELARPVRLSYNQKRTISSFLKSKRAGSKKV